jgi:murein DD-endopeptidase MepM/ murein hydrolase activator NlpD
MTNARRFAALRRRWRFALVLTLIAALGSGAHAIAQTPQASPAATDLPEGPLGEQIGWIVGAANGEEDVTNPVVIQQHFSPQFLDTVGLQGFIQFAYGLIRTYSPVTIDSIETSDSGNEAEVRLSAKDGTPLLMSIGVDPATGTITYLQIVPANESTPVASPDASPAASPIASSEPVTYAEIEADYTSTIESITAVGEDAVASFLAGDFEAVSNGFTPELQAQASPDVFASSLEMLSTNRIHFEYEEVGAVFDGHVSGGTIEGYFWQGGSFTFTLTAESARSGPVPTGTWSGTIAGPDLDISVTFAGEAENSTATLTIPSQGITGQVLRNVSYEAERPIGDLVDASALALGAANIAYRASYAWGNGNLVFTVAQDPEGNLTGFSAWPQWPLGADPALTSIELDSLFDGAWLAIWAGDTEFRNYHAVAPPQRHALDLAIWQDGATYRGDGLAVEDYYAYGQALYAPVAGEVVAVESSHPDLPPAVAQMADHALAEEAATAAAEQGPAGNHVVIRTEEGLYVFIAHMAPDSAMVAVGDTVEAGDEIGKVGNTGNTSEPHIHVHVQTTAAIDDGAAIGVPIRWNNLAVNGVATEAAQPLQGDIIEPVSN